VVIVFAGKVSTSLSVNWRLAVIAARKKSVVVSSTIFDEISVETETETETDVVRGRVTISVSENEKSLLMAVVAV